MSRSNATRIGCAIVEVGVVSRPSSPNRQWIFSIVYVVEAFGENYQVMRRQDTASFDSLKL